MKTYICDSDTLKGPKLLVILTRGLAGGVQHYRSSDGKLLTTLREILVALKDEMEIMVEFPGGENENSR